MSEHTEQCLLFRWAKLHQKKYPCLEFMFSTLNGVKLPIGLARKAKVSGNKSGVPDVILPYPSRNYHGLYIELKYGRNKPTDNQVKFINHLNNNGYLAKVAYGSKEAIAIIREYLDGSLPKAN